MHPHNGGYRYTARISTRILSHAETARIEANNDAPGFDEFGKHSLVVLYRCQQNNPHNLLPRYCISIIKLQNQCSSRASAEAGVPSRLSPEQTRTPAVHLPFSSRPQVALSVCFLPPELISALAACWCQSQLLSQPSVYLYFSRSAHFRTLTFASVCAYNCCRLIPCSALLVLHIYAFILVFTSKSNHFPINFHHTEPDADRPWSWPSHAASSR
jgi:hypothetical protein